jgi:phosphate transport system substrate-binding protein
MSFNQRFKRRAFLGSLAVVSLSFAACQTAPPETPSANAPAGSPAAPAAGGGGTISLNGAGASFPAPLYTRWFSEYNKLNPNVQISYQSVGSGAGVEQFLAGTVDFGATDDPLKAEQRDQFKQKYGAEPIQVPMTAGSVVMAYNLPDVPELKLSREALCGIVDGSITKWNDPKIASENSGVNLPDRSISFVHRSDGSGTTAVFTNHIKAACPNWKAGAAKSIEWPVGTGAKGNEGITAQVQQTQGALGYVEYAYAKQNGLTMAQLQNKTGNFITPSPEAGGLAFKGATLPADFALRVADPADPQAYPITSLTWMLFYPTEAGKYDATKAETIQSVVTWSLTDGQTFATELGYIPLPGDIETQVKSTVQSKVVAK